MSLQKTKIVEYFKEYINYVLIFINFHEISARQEITFTFKLVLEQTLS